VTPVAGGITDREKYRFIFATRFCESFFAPRIPIDRIIRVLEQVGRLFVREPVRVLAFFCSGAL
jgi:hypothetical protein